MTASTLILIVVSVSLSALAQVSFKLGVSAADLGSAASSGSWLSVVRVIALSPGILGGLVLYGIGTLLWLAVLSRTELSKAYPFVGLGFVMTALLAHVIFGDALSPMRLGGTFLVIAGIYTIAQS
jgi:drug/metabolite transporter (DMT)-like permease